MDWTTVGRPTRHPTQRHSGRTPEALHRARDEEQRWRTTTISGGTTATAEIDPGGTAIVSPVVMVLRVATTRATAGGPLALVSSSVARVTVAIVRKVGTVRSAMVLPAGIALRVVTAIVRSGQATAMTDPRGRVIVAPPAVRRAGMVRVVPIARVVTVTVRTVVGLRIVRLVMLTVRTVVGALTVRVGTVTARTAVARTVPLVMAIVRTVAGPRTGRAVTGIDPSRAVRTVRVVMAIVRTAGDPRTVRLVMVTVRTVVAPRTARVATATVAAPPTVRSVAGPRTVRAAMVARSVVGSATAPGTPVHASAKRPATTGKTAIRTARSPSVRVTRTRRSPKRSMRATLTRPPAWS